MTRTTSAAPSDRHREQPDTQMIAIRQTSDCPAQDGPFRLLFDQDCPLCRREVEWLKRFDGEDRLICLNIADPSFDPTEFGLTHEAVHEVLHGILPDGTVLRRLQAVQGAYRAVGLGYLVAPLSWPGIRWIADVMYGVFARYRVRIGRMFGRPCRNDGACGPG